MLLTESHVDISGNDNTAKSALALNEPVLRIPLPHTDFKPHINSIFMAAHVEFSKTK